MVFVWQFSFPIVNPIVYDVVRDIDIMNLEEMF
jgi:hypothetical protein